MKPGDRVEVRTRYDGSWARGFTVAAVAAQGRYVVRRDSDGRVLPAEFEPGDLRAKAS